MEHAREIYTVTRLNRAVRQVLEREFGLVWVEGEISNLARPASGHLYFSLKDADAQVRCAMFRARNSLLGFAPTNGLHVVAHARLGLYEPRGEYQLVVEHLEPAGEGLLRLKLEALKRKLAAEGLFAAERKRALPAWPRAIGVVTSASGAALRDIVHVLARRNPALSVVVYPTAVQGAAAVPGVVAALREANRRADCDVLIVARGGGSLEDLWAFNDEAVVRAIAASDIPVVSGVGHEIDVTLSDLVADQRAPTPSAAAELCSPSADAAIQSFDLLIRRLSRCMRSRLESMTRQQRQLSQRLVHPGRRLEQLFQRLDELARRLPQCLRMVLRLRQARLDGMQARLAQASPARQRLALEQRLALQRERLLLATPARLQQANTRLERALEVLRAVSPTATLERGYAIVTHADGRIARRAADFQVGETLRARLAEGQITARVEDQASSVAPGG